MIAMHFVDSNLLVYLHDSKEPKKQRSAEAIMKTLWEQASGRLSFQVLQEFYITATRKLEPGLPVETARNEIGELMTWKPLQPTATLFDRAWEVEDRWHFSWWDSLIVAAALAQNCRTLLTEDLQHGQELEGLLIINPFLPEFQIESLR